MVRCSLREGNAARKWEQPAAQHSRALTGSDGGWEAIAREVQMVGTRERGTNHYTLSSERINTRKRSSLTRPVQL
ncbi:hypothetical protein EI94DRAFT_1751730 [Lactarius quietus]|nr:hypothetical protein EI94DRAFT_1751730 [Lactarius quietus]